MAEADRTHAPGMAVLYPWLEQARGAVLAASGDLPGAAEHLGQLADRLRADGFTGHEVLVLLRPGPARPGRRPGRPDLHRRWPAYGGATPDRTLRAGRRGAAAAAGPARPGRRGGLPRRPARRRRRPGGARPDRVTPPRRPRWRCTGCGRAAPPPPARPGNASPPCWTAATRSSTPALRQLRPALSDREWEVARLAADGVTSRAIAERLYLSTRTVENHLQRVYSKLGVAGRAELKARPPVAAGPRRHGSRLNSRLDR